MRMLFLSSLLCLGLLAQAPANKAPARRAPAARSSLLNPASLKGQAPATYKVKFATTKGDFVLEVHRDWAPLGADRFYNLVKNGFYDGASFFRVLPGFVAQFGLSAKPAISKAWQTANIKDDPVKESNKRGHITYATGGPNTRTTQVFINLADNARLDGMGFAAFGDVVEGMDVVDKLYSGYGDPPRGPEQDKITNEGKAYLDKSFPQLDGIKTAQIVPAAGAAPAGKK